MAHFAKLGANGKVISVLTLDNKDMLNADGVEDETVGQQWLETHNNWPAQMWIQTSYNTSGNKHNSIDECLLRFVKVVLQLMQEHHRSANPKLQL